MSIAKAALPRPRLNVRAAEVAPVVAVTTVTTVTTGHGDYGNVAAPKQVDKRKGSRHNREHWAAYMRAYRARRKSEGRPLT